jgi:hypothetical protein
MAHRGLGLAHGRGFRFALGAALVFAPAAGAAQASAATISVDKPCYVTTTQHRAQMTVVGSGFVPGDTVVLTSGDGTVSGSGPVSATGTIAITTGAPVGFKAIAEETTTVTATDFSIDGQITAVTTVNAAPLAVKTQPARAKFTHPVTFFFSGFRPGKQIYAHYLHSKPVARERFGKARGACGVLKTKALLFPGGHPRFKTYKVQFDDAKAYSPKASPKIDTKLNTYLI